MALLKSPDVEKMYYKRNVSGLIRALSHKKSEAIVRDAIFYLGKIGKSEAVEPLISVIEREDYLSSTKKKAIISLGTIGGPQALDFLISLVQDAKSTLRIDAIKALGISGNSRTLDFLISVISSSDYYLHEQLAAIEAIGKIGGPQAQKALISVLNVQLSPEARQALIKELGKIGDNLAIDSLATLLSDNDYEVRSASVKALDEIGWKPDKGKFGAAYWAEKRDWDKCVEIGAASLEPLHMQLKSHFSEDAGRAIGKIGGTQALEILISNVESEGFSGANKAAVCGLGVLGGPEAVQALTRLLIDKKLVIFDSKSHSDYKTASKLREAAAEALDEIGWKPDRGKLGAAYWAARNNWEKCAEIGTPALDLLLPTLDIEYDEDLIIALAKIESPLAKEKLLAYYHAMLEKEDRLKEKWEKYNQLEDRTEYEFCRDALENLMSKIATLRKVLYEFGVLEK